MAAVIASCFSVAKSWREEPPRVPSLSLLTNVFKIPTERKKPPTTARNPFMTSHVMQHLLTRTLGIA